MYELVTKIRERIKEGKVSARQKRRKRGRKEEG